MNQIHCLLIALMILSVLLMGCHAEPVADTIPETTVSAPGAAGIDFSLPEGFLLNPQPDGKYEIVRDGQVVGGLVKTSLTEEQVRLSPSLHEEVAAYLESYIEPPLVMEYMAGGGKDNVITDVDLIAYDLEAQTPHEVSHYFFQMDGAVYDLFLDPEYLEWEAEKEILEVSGLYFPED